MGDMEWIENIKRIVLQAIEAGNPCDVIPGTILHAAPLEIQIDQKIILTPEQLFVPMSLTDHKQEMSIPGVGNVSATIKNALKTGEKVLLIQERGAQHYIVIDRW